MASIYDVSSKCGVRLKLNCWIWACEDLQDGEPRSGLHDAVGVKIGSESPDSLAGSGSYDDLAIFMQLGERFKDGIRRNVILGVSCKTETHNMSGL